MHGTLKSGASVALARSSLPVSGTDMPMRSEALSSQAARQHVKAIELVKLDRGACSRPSDGEPRHASWQTSGDVFAGKVVCCGGRCQQEQLGASVREYFMILLEVELKYNLTCRWLRHRRRAKLLPQKLTCFAGVKIRVFVCGQLPA